MADDALMVDQGYHYPLTTHFFTGMLSKIKQFSSRRFSWPGTGINFSNRNGKGKEEHPLRWMRCSKRSRK
jgi:hypothetical protein